MDIYKRGPLHSAEALLTAQSFGELVARYKYLHELALHDRALVQRVETLRDEIARQRGELVQLRDAVNENRTDKQLEEERLARLRGERSSNLRQAQRSAQEIQDRLARVRASESRLTNVIANDRERAAPRRGHAAKRAARGEHPPHERPRPARLAGGRHGALPVRPRVVNPNNTTTRWNGMGIAAATGTAGEGGRAGNGGERRRSSAPTA